METHHYQIAGYTFRFDNALPHRPLNFPPGFAPFRTSETTVSPAAHFTFVSDEDQPDDPPDPSHTYINCETWRFGRTRDEKLYMDIQYVPHQFWQPAAYLEPDFSSGLLFPKKYSAEEYFPYSFFFPIDEQVLLNRIARLGGGLIHSCGINYDGRAILFCGKSGAGKSTTGELWQQAGAQLMNDDRIIVRESNGQVIAAPTPWHGTITKINPANLPLAAVFHLHQARDNRTEPIPYPLSAHRLLANAIAPFYIKESMSRVMQTLSQIMAQVPSYNLYFTPDQRAVEACKRVLDHRLHN